jgi:hypothetical protein
MAAIMHPTRIVVHAPRIQPRAAQQLGWLAAAAVVGFGISALGASLLRLPRPWFVGLHLLLSAAFLVAYARASGLGPLAQQCRRWRRGLVGAVVVSAIMALSIQSQPASAPPGGLELGLALAWLGLAYGAIDALLLNVMPPLAVWRAFEAQGWTASRLGRLLAGAAGLLGSLLVTATYHLGFAEYRGPGLVAPLVGNGLMTLGALLAANPLVALAAHVVLHLASALHGIDTTVTLPPHY